MRSKTRHLILGLTDWKQWPVENRQCKSSVDTCTSQADVLADSDSKKYIRGEPECDECDGFHPGGHSMTDEDSGTWWRCIGPVIDRHPPQEEYFLERLCAAFLHSRAPSRKEDH